MPAAVEVATAISSWADLELQRAAHRMPGPLGVPDGCLSLGQQALPGRGETHALGQPFQQGATELALERPDLLGERRLRHEQPLGCARNRAGLGNGDEILELAEVHAISISYAVANERVFQLWQKRAMFKHDMNEKTHIPTRPADAATRRAVDRATKLVASRPQGEATPSWAHEASHVGDLSVLALALLD